MIARRICSSVALLSLLPVTGCCTMARLFCGPDDSRWVSVAFDTPRATAETLLEAIRRNAPDVIYQCMANSWKSRHGLGSVEGQIAWQMLEDEVTGIHLLGYAELPEGTRPDPEHASFLVAEQGVRVRIDLVRETYRQLVYEKEPGAPLLELRERHVLAADSALEWVDDETLRLTLGPLDFGYDGTDDVPLAAITSAGITRRWLVDDVRRIEE